MENKVTMEITNERLEEAIREYTAERTPQRLQTLLNLMRPTRLFIPAMLKAPNQPAPCFLKTNTGEQFLAVYTSKGQIPKEPKSQAILSVPFPECNNIVVKPELKLSGMVINPFSDNLVLKAELIENLHEADMKAAKMKQIQMTPAQFQAFVRRQVEFAALPKRLFAEGETFVNQICEEKESLISQIYAEHFKEAKLYPFTEQDYSIMALDIAEDLTLIRVDLPEKGLVAPLCYRVYITFNPLTKKAGYYTIEKSQERNVRILGEVSQDGSHVNHGEAPVEGAELQRIMDLARGEGTGLTS